MKNLKILWGIGLSLVVSSLAVTIYLLSSKPGAVDETQWIFHPDEVQTLRWRAGDKEWVFSRESGAWQPDIDARLIQSKLVALSRFSEGEGSSSTKADIQVDLGFRNGDQWAAQVTDSKVVWVTGPYEGRAVFIDGKVGRVFGEGQKAFDDRRVEWCRDRPQKIAIQLEAKTFTLLAENGGWSATADGATNALDATLVEKWLSRLCSFEVDHHIDPAPSSKWLSSPKRALRFAFRDQSQFSLERDGEAWVTSSGNGFYSLALDQLVEESQKFQAR